MKSWELPLKFCLGVAIALLLTLWGGQVSRNSWILPPVTAQSIRPEYVADIIYQRLSYLPKENQYARKEGGGVAVDNTLVSRLVRYHQDVKKRPVSFRLDWQLTLADYLGANEPMKQERYPGRVTLKANPMEADIKAIRSLNRRQRRELLDAIVSIYNPPKENPQDVQPSNASPEPTPSPSPTTPKTPPLSQPGDSQLLLP